MKIKPVGNKIQLDIEAPKAGGLSLDALKIAKEIGVVKAIGEKVTLVDVGDKVMFKAWAVDIINENGETYYFIDEDTKGICAIIK